MEFLEQGNLATLLKKEKAAGRTLSPSIIKKIGNDVLGGLIYIHSMFVVHRDLKPENILIEGEGNAIKAKIAGTLLFVILSSCGLLTLCRRLWCISNRL